MGRGGHNQILTISYEILENQEDSLEVSEDIQKILKKLSFYIREN
jgi:hypothetical protein